MEKTWIVVAEGAHARILAAENRVQPPTEISSLDFPDIRKKEQEIYSDRPGRSFETANDSRSAMEGPDLRDLQHHEFARTITDVLNKGRNKGDFEKLVLIAPPALLGALRHTLGHQLEKRVEKTIQKNLVDASADTIRDYIYT